MTTQSITLVPFFVAPKLPAAGKRFNKPAATVERQGYHQNTDWQNNK